MKKILVFRNDRFGEFLLTIPALRALKETFGGFIIAVVNDYIKELAGCVRYIDKILLYNNIKHKFSEILRIANQIKKEKCDIAVVFNPTKEAHLISFLSNIPIRVGYARKWDFLLTKKIEDKKYLARMHEVEYNLSLVNLIGASTADLSLEISIPKYVEDEVIFLFSKHKLKKGLFLVVHPFTSDKYKQWPMENFYRLIAKLKDRIKIVIVGAKEQQLAEVFSSLIDNFSVINFIGKLTLPLLGGILKEAKLLISNDSGPVHLACCVNTPSLVLFNNSILAKSSKRWGPWGERNIVIEKSSLNKISVEEVEEKILEII